MHIANKNASALDLLYRTVDSGQLFIFSVGLLGPILFTAADDPANNKKFPGRVSHFSLLVILGIIASGFYALQLSARGTDAQQLLDAEFLFTASMMIAAIALLLRYLTMVYRKSTLSFDPETELKDPVDDFAKRFADRHGGLK